MSERSTAAPKAAPAAAGVRHFGRFQLLRLIGKSERSMVWLAIDLRSGQEMMLAMPRTQPADTRSADLWQQAMRRVARLDHPRLAHCVEIGEHERWPYAAYDRANGATLAELLSRQGLPAQDVAAIVSQLLEGLAFAHEAGAAHHDIQPFMVSLNEQGVPRLLGLDVAHLAGAGLDGHSTPTDVDGRSRQREAAARDLLGLGLLMHQMLSGAPALDEPDFSRVIARMPPVGRDAVRLPWDLPRPVPEPLRAIVNRATDRQQRQRYRSARTLLRALEGWQQSQSAQGGGPLAQLLERLHAVGLLPSTPGGAARAARLALMERERTNELAEVVIEDMALAFELLRQVNSAKVRQSLAAGSGAVLTVRRAIAMLGLDGVRRAALGLRTWPGPLNDAAAATLEQAMQRLRRTAHIAQALRPAGYDDEVVYLITLLQGLGPLLMHYHFPDEAVQIEKLMQSTPSETPGEPDEPGMPADVAAFAVLGVDVEELGAAVVKHVGFDDSVARIIRRIPVLTPVRSSNGDEDMLRAIASCAHEVADAMVLPPAKVAAAFTRVAQRYGRLLSLSVEDVVAAVKGTRRSGRIGGVAAGENPRTPVSEGAL